jgi:hypothetical protein
VTLTFDQVTQSGVTTLVSRAGDGTLPAAYGGGVPDVVYDLETTASFSGLVKICINISGITFPPGSTLKVLQFFGGTWQDVTFSGPSGGAICGKSSTLSSFTVARVVPGPEPDPDPEQAPALLADLREPRLGIDDERIALRRLP